MNRDALRKLAEDRFPELPFDCAGAGMLGFIDSDEWRDWSDLGPTPDQVRIEDYLDLLDLRERTVLHIGVGRSTLADRFHRRVRAIFGTTVAPAEVERAKLLGLPNYDVVLHNKYSGRNEVVPREFDFIVDNNPSSYCCCMTHLADMLELYADRLGEGGQLITDRIGLGWAGLPGANPRWSFSFEDWEAVVATAGLQAYRIDRNVFVASRRPPARPSAIARLRQFGRAILRPRATARKMVNRARRIWRAIR